jgi:hypothetical protein
MQSFVPHRVRHLQAKFRLRVQITGVLHRRSPKSRLVLAMNLDEQVLAQCPHLPKSGTGDAVNFGSLGHLCGNGRALCPVPNIGEKFSSKMNQVWQTEPKSRSA